MATRTVLHVMPIDKKIIEAVNTGRCVLFLGAMASAAAPPKGSKFHYEPTPPSGKALSQKLAAESEYSKTYPDEDTGNLQRVSLFYESQDGKNRQDLAAAIKSEIAAPGIVPSPALRMLAALPFRIIITTNYDRLFELALFGATTLNGQQKSPQVTVYDPNARGPEAVPRDPPEAEPVLLKLHGDINKPDSIVITEEDYIEFVLRMGDRHKHPIHDHIRGCMMAWPTLFIGYGLRDYNLRLLFRTLRWNVDSNYPMSFSVDPYPDNLIVTVWQRKTPPMVSFIQEDLWQFVPDLYKAVIGKEYVQT